MSTQQLTAEVMALPKAERATLAQVIWESLHAELPAREMADILDDAVRRDEELTSGKVVGRSHEEVLKAARRAIGCD